MKQFLLSFLLCAMVVAFPMMAVAQAIGDNPSTPGTIGNNPSNPGTIGDNPGGSSGPTSGKLLNPLSTNPNFGIVDFLKAVLDVVLIFAVPIIVLFIMYSGFLFVTSRGEPAGIQKARAAFTWAVIGGVIILGAWAILGIIQGTINSIK